MHKVYLQIFCLFFLLIFPLQAAEEKKPIPLGKDVVAAATIAYEKGEYEPFIASLKAEIERAGKAGVIKNLFEKMKEGAAKGEEKKIDPETVRLLSEKLQSICAKEPQLDICKRVDQVAAFTLPPDQEAALQTFKALRYKLPEGKEPLTVEHKLSFIETRFRLLIALLDIAFTKAKTDHETRIKKQTALCLEKFARMKKVVGEDAAWQEKIALASAATQAKLAYQLDWRVLKEITAAEVAPTTSPVEAEIAQVMRETASPISGF
jgi:hypothetical protein